mgnify:CR=1 FL=1
MRISRALAVLTVPVALLAAVAVPAVAEALLLDNLGRGHAR